MNHLPTCGRTEEKIRFRGDKQGGCPHDFKKNDTKPWKRRIWCIQTIVEEFRKRMYDLLDLYARNGRQLHIIAIDEKSKETHSDNRKPMPMKPGSPEKFDYEYERKGTANIFIAVDPKRGKKIAKVTERGTKKNFALFFKDILGAYPHARKLHMMLDNLNTHFTKSILETFREEEGKRKISRMEFHYTPKHANWLNIAEIEIKVMDEQYTKRRFQSRENLKEEVDAWQKKEKQGAGKERVAVH